jgi:hypothetical protein
MSDLVLAHSIGTIVGRQNVAHCHIARDANGYSKGHAFVEFMDEFAANVAMSACDAGELILVDKQGCWCAVTASRSRRATATPTRTQSTVSAEDLFTTSVPSGELRMIL